MKKDSHFVSLIIPTIGRGTLTLTKAALKSQTRPPDELIFIFDEFRRGPAWARNKGVQKSKGDLVAFTDDDCIPGENWLERMIEAIDKYDAAMVSSHYQETDSFLNEIRLRRKFPSTNQLNPKGFIGNTGNVIYRRSCLEACQNMDGAIFNPVFGTHGSEDIELVFRLENKGYKLIFIDNKIQHLKKMSLLKYLRHQFSRGIGIGILYRLQTQSGNLSNNADKSLLWQDGKKNTVFKWMYIVWKKGLGPFDHKSFSSAKHFFVFWIGEKAQAIGFLYSVGFKFRKHILS